MKKAIDWVALAAGLVLALLGARWMWTGWDIVQAERGWTAVIAGSAMLSGGLIVAMLAWTIIRLSDAPALASSAQAGPPGLFRKPSVLAPVAAAAMSLRTTSAGPPVAVFSTRKRWRNPSSSPAGERPTAFISAAT